MKRTFFLLAAAAMLSQPLAAQPAAPSAIRGAVVTRVSITGTVNPVAVGEPPLPIPLLQQVERDPFLAELRTEARMQTGPSLILTYAFPSVEAYQAWSQAPGTRQLLADLRQRVSQLELTVSLTRAPTSMTSSGDH